MRTNSKLAIIRNLILVLFTILYGGNLFACSIPPIRPVEEKVKKTFQESNAVFIATIVKAEKYTAQILLNRVDASDGVAEIPAERVIFRVDRVFKGNLKPGDSFKTETLLGGGSCGTSVADYPEWTGHGSDENNNPVPAKRSNQWLIYNYPSQRNSLSAGTDLPLNMAIEAGDIDILESIQKLSPAKP